MVRHLIGITGLIATLTACVILPFLPGPYDPLAIPLSITIQFLGIIGLVLVPIGVLWLAAEQSRPLRAKRRLFAAVALIVVSLVWIAASLALATQRMLLGFSSIALCAYITLRLWASFEKLPHTAPDRASALPLYLIIVPIAVFLIPRAMADALSGFSRDRAVRNAAALIADIEQYRVTNGRYPLSLLSAHPDYKPSSIGIRQYEYEPYGKAYNLVFQNPTIGMGIQEFVVYNPLDQQGMTSHKMDMAQLTPAQLELERTRGHNEVHSGPRPHWKYFWFD